MREKCDIQFSVGQLTYFRAPNARECCRAVSPPQTKIETLVPEQGNEAPLQAVTNVAQGGKVAPLHQRGGRLLGGTGKGG